MPVNGTGPKCSFGRKSLLYFAMLLPAGWPLAILVGIAWQSRVYTGHAFVIGLIWAFFSPLLWLLTFAVIYSRRRTLSSRVRQVLTALMVFALAVSIYGCTLSIDSCASRRRPLFLPPASRSH